MADNGKAKKITDAPKYLPELIRIGRIATGHLYRDRSEYGEGTIAPTYGYLIGGIRKVSLTPKRILYTVADAQTTSQRKEQRELDLDPFSE